MAARVRWRELWMRNEDKRVGRTFCVHIGHCPGPHPPSTELCHDSTAWPGEASWSRLVREKGHVRLRGQSLGPCTVMTAWQLFLWDQECVLWCLSPITQDRLWNPVQFIGNCHKGLNGKFMVFFHVPLSYIVYIYFSRANECLNGLLCMSLLGCQIDGWIDR